MMDKTPETHWNHRVVRREHVFNGKKFFTFGVHEVYYTEGVPTACTVDPVEPYGETLEGLQQSVEWFVKALQQPVLNYDEIGDDSSQQ